MRILIKIINGDIDQNYYQWGYWSTWFLSMWTLIKIINVDIDQNDQSGCWSKWWVTIGTISGGRGVGLCRWEVGLDFLFRRDTISYGHHTSPFSDTDFDWLKVEVGRWRPFLLLHSAVASQRSKILSDRGGHNSPGFFLFFLCPHTVHTRTTVYVYVQGLGNGKRSTLCCSRAQHHGPQHGHLRWFVNFILESVLTEGAGMTRVRLLTVEEEEEEDEGGEEYLVQGVGAEVAASDTTYWCSVHRCWHPQVSKITGLFGDLFPTWKGVA